MATTVKAIIDRVLLSAGFQTSTSYVSTQEMALANESARVLVQLPLTPRRIQGTIAMTVATTYSLPTDFFELVPDTVFMENNLNPVSWPTPPMVWDQYRAGNIQPGAVLFCRQFGGSLQILNPVNGVNLLFEYLSYNPIQATGGGAFKPLFTLDTDEWLQDDDLLAKDFKWRWKKEKGLDWQADQADYVGYMRGMLGRTQGAMTIRPTQPWPAGEPYTNLWRA